jgi:hypothetical protein
MKKLVILSVLFIAAALMAIGCEDKKDNNKDLLSLMVLAQNALPPTEAVGSEQDVSDASSAVFATASAMSQVRMAGNPGTGMMQSVMVDSSNPYVKDSLKKSILDAVNANAMEKMKDVYAGCSGSQSAEAHLSSNINGSDGLGGTYVITPDVDVTGTFNCHSSDVTSGSFDVSIKATGTVTAVFTNMTVHVFDIENYINTTPHAITFKNVIVNGSVNISNVNVVTNVSFDYAALPLPSLKLVVKNLSGVTMASDLEINDGSGAHTVTLDLNVAEEFNFRLSLLGISGSVSAIVEGTVAGRDVSLSYGFNGDKIFQFDLPSQIGYQP